MRATATPPGAIQSFSLGFRTLIGLALTVVLALAVAAPASAERTHFLEGTVGEGELAGPNGLAVSSDGTLYVADPAAGNVRKYDAAGNPSDFDALGSNVLPVNPLAIAVDSSGGPKDGTLYVGTGEPASYEVVAYDSEGEPVSFTAGQTLGNSLRGDTINAMDTPLGLAVDPDGNLVVSQPSSIRLYAGSGAPLAKIAQQTMVPGNNPPISQGLGVAVDSHGTVFGSDGTLGFFGGLLTVFGPDAMPYSESTLWTKERPPVPSTYGHTVDPATDDLYVNHNGFVTQYESAAEGLREIGTFGGEDLPEGSNSVAIDRSGGATDGDVYVISGAKVVRFGPTVIVPTATTKGTDNVELGQAAELEGSVDPDGVEVSECRFEYGSDSSYGSSVPCEETPAEIGSGTGAVAVHASVPGLAEGDYHFRLVAANANGTSRGTDEDFSVIEDPAVQAQSAEPTFTEARLRATIDPGNAVTEYRFEYGSTAAYGRASAWETIPAGTQPVEVTASALGLSPGSTYHYRVVATNAAGSIAGPDEIFSTESRGSESCPNAGIRQSQQVKWLGECRAYEMVSPPEKEGSDLFPFFISSTAGGDEVGFTSAGAFAGSPSRANLVTYLARRDSQAWATEAVDPPAEIEGGFIIQPSRSYSPDLSKTLQASSFALAPGAIEGGSNLYLRDNATGQRKLLAAEEGDALYRAIAGASGQPLVGGTEDWGTFVLQLRETPPLAEGALPQLPNIYRYNGEGLEIVNRLPDGTPTPARVPEEAVNPISDDGSRVFFQQGEAQDGALYLRDGDQTIPISASQRSGEEGVMKEAFLQGATPDGSIVYFSSRENLLDGVETGGRDTLYEYQVETGVLTEITPFDAAAGVGFRHVVAMSDDGAYLYLLAAASLVDGIEPTSFLAANIYVWHDGDIRYIGKTTPGSQEEYYFLNESSISPDGRIFAFTSYSPVTPESDPRPGCETPERIPECLDLFVYDYGADDLSCVQCGNPDDGGVSLPQGGKEQMTGALPRAAFNDGSVLFHTPRSLLPRDVNGRRDAYMWNDGQLSMLTSGTSKFDAEVVESSADHSSVFIRTSEQLVRQDVDQAEDLYAVRVGGGLAGQEPPPAPPECEGEACRGVIAPAPPPVRIGSAPTAAGEGALPGCPGLQRRAREAAAKAAKLGRKSSKARGTTAKKLREAAIREKKRAKRLKAKTHNCGGQH